MTVAQFVDTVTGEVIDVAMTAEQARDLTDRIRQTLTIGHGLIVEAFRGAAWSALGYDTWDAYCAGEFAEARMVRLDREQRREIVAEMRQAGMSSRAIASGLGVNKDTVNDDIRSAGGNPPPAPITGTDGKTYQPPAPRPEPTPAAEPAAPKRRALTDQFFDAAYDLVKAVDRVHRLTEDDRWTRNAEQVAAKHRNDLIRTAEALAGVLDRLTQHTPGG